MKVAKITNTFWTFLILTALGMLASCVQGPANTTTQESKVFPTISTSLPTASAQMVDTDNADLTYQIQVLDETSETFRIRWYLNNFIQNSSNDQSTFTLPVNSANTGIGSHIINAKLYNADGSVLIGERTWYLTVEDAVGITGYTTSPTTTIVVSDENGTNLSQIGLKVKGSVINTYKTLKVVFYHRPGTTAAFPETTINPFLLNGGDLSEETELKLSDYDNTFAIDIDPDNVTDQYHSIIARVFKIRDSSGNSLPATQIGSDVVWTIKVLPKNYIPAITFTNLSTTPLSDSATQGTAKTYNILYTDEDVAHTDANATYKYEIKRSVDPDGSYVELNGGNNIPDTTYSPTCSGAGSTTCSITFPYYQTVNLDAPVIEQIYSIRVTATDLGTMASNSLIWTTTVSEVNTNASLAVAPTVAGLVAEGGADATVTFTVQDIERDNYCVQITRKADGLERYNKCSNSVTEAADAFKFQVHGTGQDVNSVDFSVRQDAAEVDGNVTYTFKMYEVLQDEITPGVYARGSIIQQDFTVNVVHINVQPTFTIGTVGQASQNTVMTGVPFTLAPGTFTDAAANCVDTDLDGFDEDCEGNGLLYYKWQIATAPANCTTGTWTDIPGAGNWSGTPIPMDQATTDTILTWTPPQSVAGQNICLRIAYKDNEVGVAESYETWQGALGDFITAADNSLLRTGTPHTTLATATDSSGRVVYTAQTNGANSFTVDKRSFDGTAISDLSSYTETLGAGETVIKLSTTLHSTLAVYTHLIVAAQIDTGVQQEVRLYRYDITNLALTNLGVATTLASFANDMGKIITNDLKIIFIPYVDNNGDVIVAQAEAEDFSTITETPLPSLGGVNLSINNIFNLVGVNERMAIATRNEGTGPEDWTLSSFDITGATVNAAYVQRATSVFTSNNIDGVQLEVVNDIIYAAGINTGLNSNGDQNTVAMFSAAEDDFLASNLITSILTENSVPATVVTSETSNLRSIKLKKRTNSIAGHSDLVIAVQSNLNNFHLLDMDLTGPTWTFKTTGTSYLLNRYLYPSSNTDFYLTDIFDDLTAGSDGSVAGEATKDFIGLIFESGATDTEILQINTEREGVIITSESVNSWHPGFLKTE